MVKVRIKIFALLLVIIIAAVSIGIGKGERDKDEEVVPPNTVGFLSGGWHPAPECKQCHVSLLSKGALRSKLGSCNCHRDTYTSAGKIDMNKIREKAHGAIVCVDCHVGSGIVTNAQNISSGDFHRAHIDMNCQACHGEEEGTTTPETKNCGACHPGDAHSVHRNKTQDLCVVCHGSFGKKYKERGYQMEKGVPTEKKAKEMTYPTIFNVLKSMVKRLLKI